MKKVLPNNKTINYTLDEDQIIKNNSINVEYNIKRIKKERRYTIILVICFTVLFFIIGLSIFNNIDSLNMSVEHIDNLTIKYDVDDKGVKNTISIYDDKEYSYNFYITNNANSYNRIYIYLRTDDDLIKLDNCSDKIIDYSLIDYEINGKKGNIMDSLVDDKYIILVDELTAHEQKSYELKIKLNGVGHYHSIIKVSEVK
ncbi:MAG: hypothetical protein IKE89_03175 [Bacilli bacterium]|nr:hypothetical protein [Bacilli bacterium]